MLMVAAAHDVEFEDRLAVVGSVLAGKLSLRASEADVPFTALAAGNIVAESLELIGVFTFWVVIVSDAMGLVTVLKDARVVVMLSVALEDPCVATAKDDEETGDEGADRAEVSIEVEGGCT